MVASKAGVERAGNEHYQSEHMRKIFQEGFSFSGYERDGLYLNLGRKAFLNISGVSGIDSVTDGRGAVFADFDNDGDLDVFLTTIQGTSHLLFRNNVGQENAFLRISLRGTQSGKDAYGTIVRVKTSAGILTKVKSGGAGYLAQHDPRLVFGLGRDARAEWVEVIWPSGRTQRFEHVPARASIRIIEGRQTYERLTESRFQLPDPLPEQDIFLTKLKVKIGAPFPDLTVSSLDNETKRLRDLLVPGHRYLVNLWATYCIPCATEMPELQRLSARFRAHNIEIIGLSLDTVGPQVVKKFLDQRGIRYPVYLAAASAIRHIYATDEVFIPLSFIIDEKGIIREIHGGWSRDSLQALERLAKSSPPK
ncbi:MAG: hypothetical protein D6723_10350 [Acidobacteria bacterium]|nr:MAG: hypothetical protein D6723_10350 [Acidobacteriota bacterium]